MSAEDRAALERKAYIIDGVIADDERRIPDDQFNEILRVIRETVRAEMRAEREAMKASKET